MTYPYGTRGAPVVGGGLGGLPRRAVAAAPSAPVVPLFEDFAVTAVQNSPFIHVHKRVGDTLVAVSSAVHGITLSSAARFPMFSPGGRYLAMGVNNGTRNVIRIWKCNRGVFTFLQDINESWIYSTYYLDFSLDERFLAIGTNESDNVKNVVVYSIDINTDTFTRTPDIPNQASGNISCPALSPDGTYLAVSFQANTGVRVYKWNGTQYTYLTILENGGTTRSVAFSTAGDSLIIATPSSTPKFKAYTRTNDTFSLGNTYETSSALDAFQLNVRNNYMPWTTKAYLTFSAANMVPTSTTSYADPNTACPNADATYIFSGGYYSRTLRLAKRVGLSSLTGVAETAILTGASDGGHENANRVTAATIRMN